MRWQKNERKISCWLFSKAPILSTGHVTMGIQYRPLLQVDREALESLQTERGPITPEDRELLAFICLRIVNQKPAPLGTPDSVPTSKLGNFRTHCDQ